MSDIESQKCIVCFQISENLNENLNICCMQCNCYMCKDCIIKYITIYNKKDCPKCRKRMNFQLIVNNYNLSNIDLSIDSGIKSCSFCNSLIFFILSYWIGFSITKVNSILFVLFNLLIGSIILIIFLLLGLFICRDR